MSVHKAVAPVVPEAAGKTNAEAVGEVGAWPNVNALGQTHTVGPGHSQEVEVEGKAKHLASAVVRSIGYRTRVTSASSAAVEAAWACRSRQLALRT